MFKIFKTLIVLLLFLTFQSSYAQRKTFKEIHLGEYVPKVILKGWLDQKQQPVMLSSLYKNKLLIIDFWATWCGSCILELPRLDSLQKLLKDSIKVVPVGYQTLKVTQDFFKKHPDKKFNDLHFLTNDSILTRRLFPHKGLPHLIWIDSTGKVVAITDGQNLTYNNIKQVLKTGSLAVRQKKDILNFNFLSPFHLRDTTYSARSIFTSHTPGIPSYEAWGTDTDKVLKDHFRNRIFLSNLPLIRMYWVAVFHHELSINNFGRMVFEVKDSLRFMQPKLAMETYRKSKYFLSINRDDWEQENTYCYELQMQEPRPDSLLFKYMVEDLNRYLNVNGRYENRMDDCFILKYNPHGAN
jgi:thiol-disulfide isomerase/thioredoxin